MGIFRQEAGRTDPTVTGVLFTILFDNAIALKRLLGKEMTPRRQQTVGFLTNNLTSTCDRLGWLNVECEGNRIVFSTDGYEFDF